MVRPSFQTRIWYSYIWLTNGVIPYPIPAFLVLLVALAVGLGECFHDGLGQPTTLHPMSIVIPGEKLVGGLAVLIAHDSIVIDDDAVLALHLSRITPATGLVSVMFANNEIGSVSDVMAIGKICQEKGILFHCDCVQAAGQFDLDVETNMIDFATVSSHKIHGPKGIGALYVRDRELISPLIHGGHEQEFGLRGGTENVASIVGFGKACELVANDLAEHMLKVSTLKQDFVKALADAMPGNRLSDNGIYVNGYTYLNPGKVLSLRIDGIFGESLVLEMDGLDVCISAGSACRSHEAAPSHVLSALGLNDTQARNSVRISFSRFNTKEEVEQAAIIMAECIQTLRSIQETMAQDEAEMGRVFDGGEEI